MKKGLFTAFWLTVLLASFPHQSMAATNTIELRWDELSGAAVGKDVEVHLNNGTRLQGESLAVRPDALSMDVRKTSTKLTYPKGRREVRTASVSTSQMRTLKGSRWRVVATARGVVGD